MSGILCPDDVVAEKSDTTLLAVVERTHADVDTHEPYPGRRELYPIDRDPDVPKPDFRNFMKDGVPPKGTALVRRQYALQLVLIPESKLVLIDRDLLIGDVVKKNPTDAMSGVVVNTSTKCTLQPICDVTLRNDVQGSSPAHLKGLTTPMGFTSLAAMGSVHPPEPLLDVPASELMYADIPTPEDIVIYKDWMGRVEECASMITVRLSDNGVVEIPDESVEHLDGNDSAFCVGDIIKTKKGNLRNGKWIYGKYNPNTRPMGTVVALRLLRVEFTWLEHRIGGMISTMQRPPHVLEREELESADFTIYDRTRRPLGAENDGGPSIVSNSEMNIILNLRVRFKDLTGASVKYNGSNGKGKLLHIERRDTLGYDLNVFDVVNFRTEVVVQWQDLTVTYERSINVVPEFSIDDSTLVWPAEIVHAVELEPDEDEEAVYLLQSSKIGVVQSVNATERMAKVQWCPGSCVRYYTDQEVTGVPRELVYRNVELAKGEAEEVSMYDVEATADLNVRRGDLVLFVETSNHVSNVSSREWLGEIVDTLLDGTLTVRLGAANQVRDVNVKRHEIIVAIRSDGTDITDQEGDDGFGQVLRLNSDDELEAYDDSYSEFDDDDHSLYGNGSDMGADGLPVRYEDENGVPLEEDDVKDGNWESESEDEEADTELNDASRTEKPSTEGPDPYLILSSQVPHSHAFVSQPFATAAAHTKRAAKEHRILRTPSNLPAGVYVRTWEARLDLLRVLFIGSADTPYADAPFVMDFYLPLNFPTDPPQAYFHSWKVSNGLGGVGKINPNLYEDGNVCLSLLGTWEGGGKGSTDSWSAARCTLLQVIVSVLGLVLVKEPYYNEAGYEPLAGLESSKRASAMYSEGAYLRARTFVIAALGETSSSEKLPGVEALEDVLHWIYRAPEGMGLLEKNVNEMETILERGEGAARTDGSISKGAAIALKRILDRLKGIRALSSTP